MKYICIVFKNLSVNAWKAVVHAQFCPVTGTRPPTCAPKGRLEVTVVSHGDLRLVCLNVDLKITCKINVFTADQVCVLLNDPCRSHTEGLGPHSHLPAPSVDRRPSPHFLNIHRSEEGTCEL